ncbi:MAG: hypothetical protein LC643_07920, partial [Bacteroidales bacterium]|nr:hypothetical protein [Bacteroidales bacterium]
LVNTDYSYPNNQNYKALTYLWLSKPLNNSLTLSLMGVCDAFEDVKDYSVLHPRFTYGGNLVVKNDFSRFGGTFTAYFQNGINPNKVSNDNYADLSACLLAFKLDFLLTNKLKAKTGCDYYSGSKAKTAPEKSNTFNRLYGSRHSFNGSMEYFVSIPQQGLIDYYAELNWTANKRLHAECVFHLFTFSEDFYFNGAITEKFIGSEMDALLNYLASKEISIQFGLSKFFNSSSTAKYFNLTEGTFQPSHWAYLMITVRPSLYKT